MEYFIQHATRFDYDIPVAETVMEVRKTPSDDPAQQRLAHRVTVVPAARVFQYADDQGTIVHHFNLPQPHASLLVVAESRVRLQTAAMGSAASGGGTFATLDALTSRGEHFELLLPSRYTTVTEMVRALARELDIGRRDDPLETMQHIGSSIHRAIRYAPSSTHVDSSVDEVISTRQGVCQDIAHLTLALARLCGIPCRYVSGYLARPGRRDDAPPDESHAWVEAWIPDVGWRGFNPTHDAVPGEHYIRVGVGRDYADVPPTRGVCKGSPHGRLTVGVRIWPADRVPADRDPSTMLRRARSVPARNVEQTGMMPGDGQQ